MEKKYRLEPFNLERAKAGEPVCTRTGEDVKILCYERNSDFYPIVVLRGHDDRITSYTSNGKHSIDSGNSELDLMMKVEVKEPYIYADVAGEITPFEELKASGFIDFKTLNYIIIKTYDGKFLKIWKKNLPEKEWEEAQKSASQIGEDWRCPTRHECIDIYDARFKGLDDAMTEIDGDTLEDIYWTSETDSDPQYNADYAVYFSGSTSYLDSNYKYGQYSVRPVREIK